MPSGEPVTVAAKHAERKETVKISAEPPDGALHGCAAHGYGAPLLLGGARFLERVDAFCGCGQLRQGAAKLRIHLREVIQRERAA